MMGHTAQDALLLVKKYYKCYVGMPYLIEVCLFCYTLMVSPYWLPASLVGTILAKLIWRQCKLKCISYHLQDLCKPDQVILSMRDIRKALIDTKFYENYLPFKPTLQQSALILIKLEQYAPALDLLELKEEEREDEGMQLVKTLTKYILMDKPPSNNGKHIDNNLLELLINISHSKLKSEAPKYQKLPQKWIQEIIDSVSVDRSTTNRFWSSRQGRVSSFNRSLLNQDKSYPIPVESYQLYLQHFGKGADAPAISRRGLTNLGATCYMNSALQCLHKCFQLTSRIKQSQLSHSLFVRAYMQLMEELSKDKATPFRPQEIKDLIGKHNELFADYGPHDAGELMSTVLSHLSEDLNTVTTRKVYKIDASVARTNDQLLQEYIKRDRYRSHSLIEDLFFGRFLTIYKCLQCDHQQRLFEKFSVLFLPLPARGDTDLQACMRQFLVPDRMEGKNAWWCTKCGRDTSTDKTMSVYQHSPFLSICLKRFHGNRKITSLVEFEQQITLNFVSHRPSVQQLRYELYGVINHVGNSLDYGHYFSFCLDGNTWRKYDDERVTDISPRELVTPNAFVLLYRLIK